MELEGPPAELRFTLTIKRAATGKVETFEMVGHSDPEKLAEVVAQPKPEVTHGSDPLDGST
jgi:hypothetical protein